MITVKVPATTANIGPGFDTLGLAFKLYSYFTFKRIEYGLRIVGCEEKYQNDSNLVYTSFKKTLEILNYPVPGIEISIKSDIPISRGLGSSAACIVGGVMGANIIAGSPLSKDEIFKICNDIEGHPDNIAPALFGGLTASLVEDSIPYTVQYNISENLYFCALVPDFRLSTAEARKVLPSEISYKDAIYNISRTAVLLKALENGDELLIKKSLSDRLHEKYRNVLINEYEEVKEICEKNGNTALFISGSGPTLMNIAKTKDFQWKIEYEIKNLKNSWIIRTLDIDMKGAVVL